MAFQLCLASFSSLPLPLHIGKQEAECFTPWPWQWPMVWRRLVCAQTWQRFCTTSAHSLRRDSSSSSCATSRISRGWRGVHSGRGCGWTTRPAGQFWDQALIHHTYGCGGDSPGDYSSSCARPARWRAGRRTTLSRIYPTWPTRPFSFPMQPQGHRGKRWKTCKMAKNR